MSEPVVREVEAHTMHCMEIWGGNKAVESAIATPGLDIYVYSAPYKDEDHGGDVHYVSLCGGGIITRLILADVSGHGESVASFSDGLRTLMRRNINNKSQKQLVRALNRQFTELAQMRRFATALIATYLATSDRLSVCNAAHPRPLWYRAQTGAWSLMTHETTGSIDSPSNLPLGIDEEMNYDQSAVKLDTGDVVIFYTDALMEAPSPSGAMLGEEGLLQIARGVDRSDPARLGRALVEAVARHRGGVEADDDVTLLVLHHNGGPPRRASIAEKVDVYAKVFGLKRV